MPSAPRARMASRMGLGPDDSHGLPLPGPCGSSCPVCLPPQASPRTFSSLVWKPAEVGVRCLWPKARYVPCMSQSLAPVDHKQLRLMPSPVILVSWGVCFWPQVELTSKRGAPSGGSGEQSSSLQLPPLETGRDPGPVDIPGYPRTATPPGSPWTL